MTGALAHLADAAKPPGSADTRSVLLWVFVLIVLVMGLGVAIMIVRRRMFARDSGSAHQQTFMEDLRGMRDRGEITQEEFDAAKKTMVARLKGGTGAPRAARERREPPPGQSG